MQIPTLEFGSSKCKLMTIFALNQCTIHAIHGSMYGPH